MDKFQPLSIFKAQDEKEIHRYGTYIDIDSEGYLVSKSDVKNIPAKWMEMVKDVTDICKRNIGENNLVSVFVDGSVAKGMQVDNVSDLDMMIVCRDVTSIGSNNLGNLDSPWFVKEKEKLYKRYSFTNRVHLSACKYEDVLNSDNTSLRFSIKNQSALVYGKDIGEKIERFKPERKLAKELLKNFPQKIDEYLKRIRDAATPNQIEFSCFMTSKSFLRNGFILVMPEEKKFTTSLYLAFESLSKYFPNKKQEIYTVLYLSQNPTTNKSASYEFFNNFGGWLKAKYLDLQY
jgi:hypothetical protein